MKPEITKEIQVPVRAGKAALILMGIVIAVAGFLALGYVLELTPLYAGFLFLWYWGSVETIRFSALPSIVCGALGGIATAWLLQYCTHTYGLFGVLPVLFFILCVVYAQIMNWFSLVINAPYMLFLTVTTAPILQGSEDLSAVMLVVMIGSLYFGVFIFIGRKALVLFGQKKVI